MISNNVTCLSAAIGRTGKLHEVLGKKNKTAKKNYKHKKVENVYLRKLGSVIIPFVTLEVTYNLCNPLTSVLKLKQAREHYLSKQVSESFSE